MRQMRESALGLDPPLSQHETTTQHGGRRPPSHFEAPPLARVARAAGLALATLAVVVVLLVTLGPLLGPYKVLTVYSGSMEPTIHTGAVIVVLPVAARDVGVGDIITFQKPSGGGGLVTHRVVAMEGTGADRSFITKGDANAASDGWRVPANGNGYRYWFGIPGVGFALAWIQSPLGRVLFLLIPAIALAGITLFELWRPRSARAR